MTKEKAIHEFFSGFDLPAYASASVPDEPALPYLTYDLSGGAWDSGEASITVQLWFYTDSEAIPNAKAAELSAAIGMGGVMLRCDDGAVWLKRGVPWCQSRSDAENKSIKLRYINVTAEFLTQD